MNEENERNDAAEIAAATDNPTNPTDPLVAEWKSKYILSPQYRLCQLISDYGTFAAFEARKNTDGMVKLCKMYSAIVDTVYNEFVPKKGECQ